MSGDVGLNPPLQERSRAALERILTAAERLVSEGTFGSTGIQEITREAGVAVGSFYARFESKEALLVALYSRYLDRIEGDLQEWERLAEGQGYRDCVRTVIEHLRRRWTREKGLVKAFLLHFRSNEVPAVANLRPRLMRIFDGAVRFLATPAPEDCRESVIAASEVVVAVILCTLREEIIFDAAVPMRRGRGKDWPKLFQGLEDMSVFQLESATKAG